MSFKTLLSMCDEKAREEIGDYLIIPKMRIEELANNFEKQVIRIKEMANVISEQQEQIGILQVEILKDK